MLAIGAAQQTTDSIKWVAGVVSGLIALIITAAGVFGWRTFKDAAKTMQAKAEAKHEKALAAFKTEADAKAEAAIREIQAATDIKAAAALKELEETATRRWQETMTWLQNLVTDCNIVCVNCLEAVRNVLLSEQWADTTPGKINGLREALQATLKAQHHAKQIKGMERTVAWTIGMEAYIQSSLRNFKDAVDAQLRHIEAITQLSPERLASEWHFYFNLACYYTLDGDLENAVSPLRKAIQGREDARIEAWTQKDLRSLIEDPEQFDKLKDLLGERPQKQQPAVGPAGVA